MGELGAVAAALETFTPGAAGVWTLVVMIGAYLLREWRETRKLSAEDRLARRDGYAAQVAMLMNENRSLRDDLSSLERRHDEYRAACQKETADLQRQIIKLEGVVDRLRAKIATDEAEIARLRSVRG